VPLERAPLLPAAAAGLSLVVVFHPALGFHPLSKEAPVSLTLHYHPLSSFCQKALVGLYELDVPFEKHLVDLGDPASRAAFLKVWPLGRFPVLRDDAAGRTVPESTIILEYVDREYARGGRLVPADADRALECRLRDRFYDLYVSAPMSKIVTDNLRPEGQRDAFGVEEARTQLRTAYAVADDALRGRTWAAGDAFTVADCAAAPALFYAAKVVPFAGHHRHLASYFERLAARPSFARVVEEAKPYWSLFPAR
jgi:glutathione S-transferase